MNSLRPNTTLLANEVRCPPSACLSDLGVNAALSEQSETTLIVFVPDKTHKVGYLISVFAPCRDRRA